MYIVRCKVDHVSRGLKNGCALAYEKYKRTSASKNLSHHKGAMKQLIWSGWRKKNVKREIFRSRDFFLSRFLFVASAGMALPPRDYSKRFCQIDLDVFNDTHGTKWDHNRLL